jgi:choline dehydrogenase-like flavoprotein
MNLHSQSVRTSDETVVVIGSGPAGAAAAVQLTAAGVKVTLVEAGLPNEARGLTARLRGLTVMRVHRPLHTRTDGLTITGDPSTLLYEDIAPGGLTNHWSCAVPRFSPDDFLDGRRAGEAFTWPIDYADLEPWYDRVEPWLQISGTMNSLPQLPAGKVRDVRALGQAWQRIAAAAEVEGQAIVPVPYVYGARTTLTLSGTVFNSFVRLVKPRLGAGLIEARFGKQVTQLEWSGGARRVTAVLARDRQTGADERIPCRAVVVAAGAVNTAKLFLQSTSADFPHGLGNTHGVLGGYLHDHPIGKLMVDLNAPLAFTPAAYITRLPLDRTIPLFAASALQWSGVQHFVRSTLQGHPGRLSAAGFSLFGTMAPTPDNFVALDTTKQSDDGSPGTTLHIRYPPESKAALEATRDQVVHLFDRVGLEPKVSLWAIDPVGSAIHFAGSCRMHASPRFGMLDAWSRMHAVPNVVVADSAAFTTGSEKNPVLTAMALAARASQRLVDDLRCGDV